MRTSKVILSGYILVPEGELKPVLDALPRHIELTQAESGNLVFEVTQDDTNPCRFNVYEEFVDQEAFEAHQERARNSAWGQVTQNVERYYKISSSARS